MSRYVLGPVVPGPVNDIWFFTTAAEPPPVDQPKGDVTVSLLYDRIADEGRTIIVNVPPYDAATHNILLHVHCIYAPAPVPEGADANWFVSGGFPASMATAPPPDQGGDVTLSYLGENPDGGRHLQIVLEFDA